MKPAPVSRLERFQGCLLGGAVGDALGAPVEFMSLAAIREVWGPDGVTRMESPGHFTDDTQMFLFTAEGLLAAAREGSDPVERVLDAYLRWMVTQGESSCNHRFDPAATGGLMDVDLLKVRRSPGATCVTALRRAEAGALNRPINMSKGCGGVMRVAPVGLALRWDPFALGCATAALTHGHPSGWVPGGVMARLVRQLVEGQTLDQALDGVMGEMKVHPGHTETLEALEGARKLAARGSPSPETLSRLGAGWVGEEALAIGVWCALVARDFAHGVSLAVSHSGDSDSTGLIAGHLLGALLGPGAIPAQWMEELEYAHGIRAMADELYRVFGA